MELGKQGKFVFFFSTKSKSADFTLCFEQKGTDTILKDKVYFRKSCLWYLFSPIYCTIVISCPSSRGGTCPTTTCCNIIKTTRENLNAMQNQNKVYYIIQPPPQQNALAPLTSPGPLDFECQQTSPKVYIFLTNNTCLVTVNFS